MAQYPDISRWLAFPISAEIADDSVPDLSSIVDCFRSEFLGEASKYAAGRGPSAFAEIRTEEYSKEVFVSFINKCGNGLNYWRIQLFEATSGEVASDSVYLAFRGRRLKPELIAVSFIQEREGLAVHLHGRLRDIFEFIVLYSMDRTKTCEIARKFRSVEYCEAVGGNSDSMNKETEFRWLPSYGSKLNLICDRMSIPRSVVRSIER